MLPYLFLLLTAPAAAFQQSAPQAQAVPPITLPTVVVTAQKEPADARELPVSVSAVPAEDIAAAGATGISDLAPVSPNTVFAELSARKVSNAYIRGIGSSPANPGVTTYIDGVPQLHANSSNIELLEIDQVEFVRGPQSALFGRNTLGGLVTISSARPSLSGWTGHIDAPLGSSAERGLQGAVSGPLSSHLGVGVAVGHRERDGFTVNDLTGRAIDARQATFGRAQLLWIPTPNWETRLIVSGERARDGDYALNDLEALRARPFHASRDFEGYGHRDIWSSTVLVRHEGQRVAFSSTTGVVTWSTEDATDLDYSGYPIVTRNNAEDNTQLTQEFRLASSPRSAMALGHGVTFKWQTGVVFFTQQYTQSAVNTFSALALSQYLAFPIDQHSPDATLDDTGVGAFGLGTVTVGNRVDLAVGARFDREQRTAALRTYFAPAIAPETRVDADRTYSDVSPQASVTWRVTPGRVLYASVGRGFKAGGFNPASPAGSESYGEEHAWNTEAGLKTTWAGGRVSLNAAAYRIAWDDMQLNVPNPYVPAQFYIANVGQATSTGVEFEAQARLHRAVDLFATYGLTHGRFGDGSRSGGVDVSGNELPNAPGYTASVGLQVSRAMRGAVTCYGRADVVFYGAYHYDDQNTQGQDAYSLANARAGIQVGKFGLEGWVRNAFDTKYIPVAFAFPGFAPSGFMGESGRPRTFGVSLTAGF